MGILLNLIFSQAKSQLGPSLFPRSQIDGLQDRGIAQHKRHSMTEFGSGWRGHKSFEEGLIGPGSPPGPRIFSDKIQRGWVIHEAEDFADELPFYLLPELEQKAFTQKSIPGKKYWKIAAAAGLLGLYMSKPLSMFSGRDDEANTIEGLRHGGLSQQLRRKNTPFGSGWDPMRALAREAGLSLEKFVAQPHMKLAMASGDVIRELGQGSYGKVHLMESSVRIGEKEHTFQYARKSIFENDYTSTFHEVKSQRKLQDLNAPSVYGWSGSQVFMEPIYGQSAYGVMREGGQLPESFISDMEKFVPEMHARGVAHMDMSRDMNKLLGKPVSAGKSGEIVPHNVMVTPEGRAAVFDYGMSMRPGKADLGTQNIHQLYTREKFSTNAELDMSLVSSLRRNQGKLSPQSFSELNKAGRSTPIIAPPSARTMQAKARSYSQSVANKQTARDMFRIGSGRKSKSAYVSSRK